MEFKGTKGKWERITADWDLEQEIFIEDTEIIIAKVFGKPHEQIHNALLISKSPEMLEMLQRIENILTYDTIEPNSPLQEEIYNLINQATEL